MDAEIEALEIRQAKYKAVRQGMMQASIGNALPVADLTEPSALLSIYKVCSTNAGAM